MKLDGCIFSKRLRLLMATYNLTYDLIVEYINLVFEHDQVVSRTSVHRWVTDKRLPNMASVLAISFVFGISSDWLIGISSEPFTLETLNMQEKIGKGINDDIKTFIDYDVRRDGPWNLMCASEALFIYNLICLRAQKLWLANKELEVSDVYATVFLADENLEALFHRLKVLVETNKPYFDLRGAIQNEKRCA